MQIPGVNSTFCPNTNAIIFTFLTFHSPKIKSRSPPMKQAAAMATSTPINLLLFKAPTPLISSSSSRTSLHSPSKLSPEPKRKFLRLSTLGDTPSEIPRVPPENTPEIPPEMPRAPPRDVPPPPGDLPGIDSPPEFTPPPPVTPVPNPGPEFPQPPVPSPPKPEIPVPHPDVLPREPRPDVVPPVPPEVIPPQPPDVSAPPAL